jgi:hypothetical protein
MSRWPNDRRYPEVAGADFDPYTGDPYFIDDDWEERVSSNHDEVPVPERGQPKPHATMRLDDGHELQTVAYHRARQAAVWRLDL